MGIGAIRFMWYEGVEHMPPDVRFLYRVATCGFWPDSAFQPNFSRPKRDFQSFEKQTLKSRDEMHAQLASHPLNRISAY